MHDQHGAQPLANRGDDELLERFLGGALDHAVHIEMRLYGELAAAKLRHESRVQSDAVSLEVFVRLGDIEGRLSRYQVRQLRDYLRVLIDDRVSHWRFERYPRPAIAFAIQRTYALERAPEGRLRVEQLVMQVIHGLRGFFDDPRRRRRGLGLDCRGRRRQLSPGEHFLQVFEWRRKDPLGCRRRLSFAVSFVILAAMLSLFCHRTGSQVPDTCTTRQTTSGTQCGSNRGRDLKRSDRKIVWVSDARSVRID